MGFVHDVHQNLDRLVQSAHKNELLLPNFQREFTWKLEKIRDLLASLLVEIPTGSLLILESENREFSTRPIGRKSELPRSSELNKPCRYLLDGQQRVSVMKSVFYDSFAEDDWVEAYEDTFQNLRYRWFLSLRPEEGEEDIFGYDHLKCIPGKHELNRYNPDTVRGAISWEPITPPPPPQKSNRKGRPRKVQQPRWWDPHFGEDVVGADTLKNKIHSTAALEIKEDKGGFRIPLHYIGADGQKLRDILTFWAEVRKRELLAKLSDNFDVTWSEEFLELHQDRADALKAKDPSAWSAITYQWAEQIHTQLSDLRKRVLPVILVPADEIDRAVATFEAVNAGGQPLDTFDLVVARAAPELEEGNLTAWLVELMSHKPTFFADEPWDPSSSGLLGKEDLPSKQVREWYLNLLSLYTAAKNGQKPTVGHIKSKKHMELSPSDIRSNTPTVVKSIVNAIGFLQLRCGIQSAQNIHYNLMLLPVAYTFSVYDSKPSTLALLEYWWWSSLLGGAYEKAQNQVVIKDIAMISAILGGERGSESWQTAVNRFPERRQAVLNHPGYSSKNDLIPENTDDSTSYAKGALAGLSQFILSRKPHDFLPQKELRRISTFSDEELEMHHIWPLGASTTIGQSSKQIRKSKKDIRNSPLNFTLISKSANRALGNMDYARYSREISPQALESHRISQLPEKSEELEGKLREFLEKRLEIIRMDVSGKLDELESLFGHYM